MMTEKLPIRIRPIDTTPMMNGSTVSNQEKAFIASSWFNTYKHHTPHYSWIHPSSIHRGLYQDKLLPLIERRPELFHVALNETDETQILGWACRDSNALHFVYVKKAFRCWGVCRALVGDLTVVTNHSDAKNLLSGKEYKPELFVRLIK